MPYTKHGGISLRLFLGRILPLQRLNEAAARTYEGLDGRLEGGKAYTSLFLAMCHDRLGHQDGARQWLAQATAWIEAAEQLKPEEPTDDPLPWCQRLELQLLRREAEALLSARWP